MKIGIFGLGFVGKAVCNSFQEKCQTIIYDPKINKLDKEIFDTEFIFVSVPTPQLEDSSIDVSFVENVFSTINENLYRGIVVLKSTVTPTKLENLINKFSNLQICYNPEFLTEANYLQDFNNSTINVIGCSDENHFEKLKNLYLNYSSINKNCKIYHSSYIEASMIKYTVNSFLATKVIFMNEINKLSKSLDKDFNWELFTDILKTEGRMGTSHFKVPGHNNEYGFGGSCFPKDTNALLSESKSLNNASLDVLNAAIQKNIKLK